MARVRDVGIEEVPEAVQPIYRRYAETYGPFLNQVKVFAHRPPVLKHIMGLLLDLADEALLPKRYLEIAVVVVSKLNECTYCVAHHTPRLAEQGLPSDTIARILEPDCPGLDEIDRLVRDYAVQVTRNPQRLDDALYARLRQQFSEEQIVELTLRIALCGFFNRFNDALQIDIEDGVIDAMPAHTTPHPVAGD
ncbi:carboxymuconolactone decarboxylase family protein [Candidatus Entotheonella palauensis]|uniref:Phage infection protein n=1 Tax=Candidatus Entotheonella gemina TaxID=1429439 RepID=W4M2H3_9BACT|nr:carboxymuconolactone decarboxylase family protein [Candidatus Entotheonella palauensis]ETX04358.1 MAG: phage infection protein [Candidatus Entotheonella gemina]